jgi:hypothetical protein
VEGFDDAKIQSVEVVDQIPYFVGQFMYMNQGLPGEPRIYGISGSLSYMEKPEDDTPTIQEFNLTVGSALYSRLVTKGMWNNVRTLPFGDRAVLSPGRATVALSWVR